MKLMIFDPGTKPLEVELADINNALQYINHAQYGDSGWAVLNDDGTVFKSGMVENFSLSEFLPSFKQEALCEKCNVNLGVQYSENEADQVDDDLANQHRVYSSKCSMTYGSQFIVKGAVEEVEV